MTRAMIIGTFASLILWAVLVAAVNRLDRMKCELTTSVDTCAWELR